MSLGDRVFPDAGLFIGALLADDPRHTEPRGIVEAAREGRLRPDGLYIPVPLESRATIALGAGVTNYDKRRLRKRETVVCP